MVVNLRIVKTHRDCIFLILQLTESEISSLYERLSGLHRRRLMAFYQVRSLFAQIVEGVILLDRLVSILQQVGLLLPRFLKDWMYCAVRKNSVPAAAGAVATSHTVFLLNRVIMI